MTTISESYVMLECGKCGHESDFMDFCSTPITGDLPRGTYQCPSCKNAWRMEKFEEGQFLDGGLYIPPGCRPVAVPTIL
jgi:hypothetical protein